MISDIINSIPKTDAELLSIIDAAEEVTPLYLSDVFNYSTRCAACKLWMSANSSSETPIMAIGSDGWVGPYYMMVLKEHRDDGTGRRLDCFLFVLPGDDPEAMIVGCADLCEREIS